MEDFSQVIEALSAKFIDAKNTAIIQPITVRSYHDTSNTIIFSLKEAVYYGENKTLLKKDEILFIPSGRKEPLQFGEENSLKIGSAGLSGDLDDFLKTEEISFDESSFTFLTFEVRVFEAINFFLSLDIPAFTLNNNDTIRGLIQQLIKEGKNKMTGYARLITLLTDQVMIETMRYIEQNNLFIEQFATNMTYLKDPRLLDIFTYIKENLQGDLSNKALADVAHVSEDYVGQYFKLLTGINPQDYIEYQRMEKAVQLLRTSKRSIREIGGEVGYKDTAYFCRRFKMMFGLSAGKMRRREVV